MLSDSIVDSPRTRVTTIIRRNSAVLSTTIRNRTDTFFLTNAMDITALEVALLYKNRWSVELFFKWVKQHLKIKKFWGRLRKRSPHPDLHRNHLILPGSHCSSQDETQDIGLQHAPSSGNLTHRHHISRRPLQQI